jgi:demethylmenaquinone methyltransferase/2-methoxy-6-polyprenyl-1,4-benzoquinol methylase
MKRFRRFYYDIFSHFYDLVIQLHSKDESSTLRDFLIKKTGVGPGDRVLDICTGTGAVAMAAHKVIVPKGLVVGLDFSYGMLSKAREKARKKGLSALYLVMGDVGEMPFKGDVFECATCSHSMYELESETRMNALNEICRALKENGRFFMMEHCKPRNPFIRLLYYVRLMFMGSPENRDFAEDEVPVIKRFFKDVKRELSPTGKSKLISGINCFKK